MRVQSWMRGRQHGKYHVKRNNCHHFVDELLHRISLKDKLAGDDASLQSSNFTGSTSSLKTSLDDGLGGMIYVTKTNPTPDVEKGLLL
jgi:hypothetical protein